MKFAGRSIQTMKRTVCALALITASTPALSMGLGDAFASDISGASLVSVAVSAGVSTASPQTGQLLLKLGAGASVTLIAMGTVFDGRTTVAVQHEPSGEMTVLEVPADQLKRQGLKVGDKLTVRPFPGGVELRPIGENSSGPVILDGRGKALLETVRRPPHVFNR